MGIDYWLGALIGIGVAALILTFFTIGVILYRSSQYDSFSVRDEGALILFVFGVGAVTTALAILLYYVMGSIE